MNLIKAIIVVIVLAVIGYFVFQEKIEAFEFDLKLAKEEISQPKVVVKKRIEDGKLKADAEIVDGIRHGVANNYYSDGSVHSKVYYVKGVKEGESTWFYKNGKPYRVTPFVKGEKHGSMKKYYDDGVLMAEIPYEKGMLLPGTKEYWETGKLKTKYPEIIIDQNRKKLLMVSIQPYVSKAKYYAFVVYQGETIRITGEEKKKEGIIDLRNYSGEANLFVEYKTKMGNKKLEKRMVQL